MAQEGDTFRKRESLLQAQIENQDIHIRSIQRNYEQLSSIMQIKQSGFNKVMDIRKDSAISLYFLAKGLCISNAQLKFFTSGKIILVLSYGY